MTKYYRSTGVGNFLIDPYLHDYKPSDAYKIYEKLSAKYRDKFHVDRPQNLNLAEQFGQQENTFKWNGGSRQKNET